MVFNMSQIKFLEPPGNPSYSETDREDGRPKWSSGRSDPCRASQDLWLRMLRACNGTLPWEMLQPQSGLSFLFSNSEVWASATSWYFIGLFQFHLIIYRFVTCVILHFGEFRNFTVYCFYLSSILLNTICCSLLLLFFFILLWNLVCLLEI